MPAGQPFTLLCQAASRSTPRHWADLHLHTTHSDGQYTPAEVVDLARRSGLRALSITDHDTLSGIVPARAAAGMNLEIVPGVEISAEFRGREVHLLGYFVAVTESPLSRALDRLRQQRRERFQEMLQRLRRQGIDLRDEGETCPTTHTLGRRHLAEMLVRQRKVGTVREAFRRFLADGGRADVPKVLLPIAEAIACVRAVGGVTSWAHPGIDCDLRSLAELRDLGLQGVEAEYPTFKPSQVKALRKWANNLGLAITGGSDCHGPALPSRAVGIRGVTHEELEALRARSFCLLPPRY